MRISDADRSWRYLIALGSNIRHHRHGAPEKVLKAAIEALAEERITIETASPIITSAPLGHSLRCYANCVAEITTRLEPEDLLDTLKRIESVFGRRAGGRRWNARVLDLDIVLWGGGCWCTSGLIIPHPEFRNRRFVLSPAARIAPHWRDPITGLTLRQQNARLTRRLALPKRQTIKGP